MENVKTEKKPLWLLIEEKILELSDSDLAGSDAESAVQKIAGQLDAMDVNVSLNGGNMIELRSAVLERVRIGNPMMKDVNGAISTLKLEDIECSHSASLKITGDLGEKWTLLLEAVRRPDVKRMVEEKKLDLQIKKAQSLSGDEGIRFLIEAEIASEVIVDSLGVSEEKLAEVNAAIEAERAEKARVEGLLEAVADKTDEEKVKHLINGDAADALIIETAGVDQAMIETVKKSMEEEIKEKQRLAEEEAAKKKAAAEGPAIEDIPPDEMLEHLEAIEDILGFSEDEAEIRQMCEQSALPKCLVDIAVTDKAKLEELQEKAEAAS